MLFHFDFINHDGEIEPLTFRRPLRVVMATTLDQVRPALHEIQAAVHAGNYAAGYISYESAPAFDSAMHVNPHSRLPLLYFGIFAAPSNDPPTTHGEYACSAWQPATTRQRYDAAIDQIRHAIERGDTYQVNYTLPLHAQFQGDAWALYQDLRAAQQAQFCAYLDCNDFQILSLSPELFFAWRDGQIVTKPMKGTRRRGRWYADDQAIAQELHNSEKDRAENLMIVDLLRNDLGRIAQIGSVQVSRLFEPEQYPTVWQMTSTITAQTRTDTTLDDVFAALFPCGSITGAPKIKTMQIISELEQMPREVYCGSIGVLRPDGSAMFNVAIRTMTIDRSGHASYHVGGGITWDSQAHSEYDEAWSKAAILQQRHQPFHIFETIKFDGDSMVLLDRHLRRMAQSAAYFGFRFDEQQARSLLNTVRGAPQRIRLLLDGAGKFEVQSTPMHQPCDQPQLFAVASKPIDSSNRWLYHKTTNRHVYDQHRAQHDRVFDVLLWNERGEITEFTIGNVVLEIDGINWTPPRGSGLLAGTLREELLAQGMIHERVLTLDDLNHAAKIWLINSVRGWVAMHTDSSSTDLAPLLLNLGQFRHCHRKE